MKQEKDFIEVPFGARDSELGGFEYTIPQGFEAEIKDGKVIVRKAESEDEKIRRELLIDVPKVFPSDKAYRYIAWLEKCAPKTHNDVGQYIKLNCEPYSFMIPSDLYPRLDGYNQQLWRKEIEYAYSNGRKDERKECEQKPVECCADKLWTEFKKQVAYLMASSYNREHEYTKGYVEWVAQSLLGYAKNEIEQKPAEWSEEDKTMLCYMEGHLEYLKNDKGYSSSEDQIMLKRQLEWLKSLKDRCLPQPKQEWSGEDEKHYQGCLNLMKLSLDTKPYPYYNDYLWLKSLKDRVQPQNTWKPTEEQIGAVEKEVLF